jgi:hypothetical protein
VNTVVIKNDLNFAAWKQASLLADLDRDGHLPLGCDPHPGLLHYPSK